MLGILRANDRQTPFGIRFVMTAGTNLFVMSISVATSVIVARLLGPEGRGELAAIQTWCFLFATAGTIGIPEAIVFFSGRDPNKAGTYLASGVSVAMISIWPFVLTCYFLLPVILARYPANIISTAQWYVLLIPFANIYGLASAPLQGKNDLWVWNIFRVLPNISWLGILLVVLFKRGVTAGYIATLHMTLLLALCLPIVFVVWRRLHGPFSLSANTAWDMVRYGVPSITGGMTQQLNLRLDQLFISALLPPAGLGLYAVAAGWSNGVNPILTGMASVFFPQIASRHDSLQREQALIRGTRVSVMLTLAVGGVCILVTPVMLPLLFGKNFSAATPIALVLLVSASISGLNGILESGLRGLGAPSAVVRAEFAGLLVMLASTPILIFKFSLMGASLGALICSLAVMSALIFQVKQITGSDLRDLFFPTMADFAAAFMFLRTSGARISRLITN